MWAALASMALNKIGQNNAQEEQKMSDEISSKQNLLASQKKDIQNRSQFQGMQDTRQQAHQRQQSVLDNIMQKYRIGGA